MGTERHGNGDDAPPCHHRLSLCWVAVVVSAFLSADSERPCSTIAVHGAPSLFMAGVPHLLREEECVLEGTNARRVFRRACGR